MQILSLEDQFHGHFHLDKRDLKFRPPHTVGIPLCVTTQGALNYGKIRPSLTSHLSLSPSFILSFS